MPILEFEDSQAKKPASKKPLKLVLGAGVLVGALAIGSTFASNISLNSGNNFEFGQGIATTTACDGDGIEVTPYSSFTNAPGAVTHKLTSIRISGIDSSACDGKTFRIKAYGDGPDPLDLFSWETGVWNDLTNEYDFEETGRYDFVDITRTGGDFLWTSDGTDDDDVVDVVDSPLSQTAFTINLDSNASTVRRILLASASDVKRITVETFTASEQEVVYTVGDPGPAGGIIFYVADTPFACGPTLNALCQYLEAAPNNWSNAGVGSEDPRRTWAATENQMTSVAGAVGTAIGTGYSNSIAIASQTGNNTGNSAAVLAREYEGGGEADWYLPSSEELRKLWQIQNLLEYFSYWSSTQNDGSPGQAWDSGGDNPTAGGQKWSDTPVRPIRAF